MYAYVKAKKDVKDKEEARSLSRTNPPIERSMKNCDSIGQRMKKVLQES